MKILKNPVFFALFYILFMIPTYILPYFGSNSTLANGLAIATHHANPAFYLHLLSLLVLGVLAWMRGSAISKRWLVIFPLLALVFDLVPGLDAVPFVPTVMHLLAIILGVISANSTVSSINNNAKLINE